MSEPPKCKCGNPASWRTVNKEGKNKGRNFWGCTACNFFSWAAPGALPPAAPPLGAMGAGAGAGGGRGWFGTPTRPGGASAAAAAGGGGAFSGGSASSVTHAEVGLHGLLPVPEVFVKHAFNSRLVEAYKAMPQR